MEKILSCLTVTPLHFIPNYTAINLRHTLVEAAVLGEVGVVVTGNNTECTGAFLVHSLPSLPAQSPLWSITQVAEAT